MKKTPTLSIAEDVVRLYQALAASLKGIRSLAERLKKDTPDGHVKEQMDKVLSRSVLGQKVLQAKPKKERPAEGERRLRKVGRLLAALSDGQIHLVLGLARSLVQPHKGERPPKGAVPLDEKRSTPAGDGPAHPSHNTLSGKD